jgi:hypothetical protein
MKHFLSFFSVTILILVFLNVDILNSPLSVNNNLVDEITYKKLNVNIFYNAVGTTNATAHITSPENFTVSTSSGNNSYDLSGLYNPNIGALFSVSGNAQLSSGSSGYTVKIVGYNFSQTIYKGSGTFNSP